MGDSKFPCCVCRERKSADNFGKEPRNTGRGGLRSVCNCCQAAATRALAKRYVEKNKASPPSLEGEKRCSKCGASKPKSEFYRENSAASGFKSSCKLCMNRGWKPYALKRNFGMTMPQYQVLLDMQGHGCAICGVLFSAQVRPAVDHDHKTGDVRSLLCSNCNTGLGMFKEDILRLRKAIGYLALHHGRRGKNIAPWGEMANA